MAGWPSRQGPIIRSRDEPRPPIWPSTFDHPLRLRAPSALAARKSAARAPVGYSRSALEKEKGARMASFCTGGKRATTLYAMKVRDPAVDEFHLWLAEKGENRSPTRQNTVNLDIV